MNIIFAGTPEFAAVALAALLDQGHQISLVLTQPDRPAGRGMHLQPSPVKQLALDKGLEIYQPLSLKKDLEAQDKLRQMQPELMVVAAYGLILPQTVLDIPTYGCLNIHASLLPRWRGAAPIQRAIQAGDAETGVCIMQMAAGLDTGPVLARVFTPITEEDTAASLHDRLAQLGASLLGETLTRLPLTTEPQAEEGITYAAKIEKHESMLDWRLPAQVLDRQIRAFNPFPGCQSPLQGQPVKIWRAHPVSASGIPGEVLAVDRQGIVVACGEGALCLTELQKASGKRLEAAQFLAGHSVKPKDSFGNLP